MKKKCFKILFIMLSFCIMFAFSFGVEANQAKRIASVVSNDELSSNKAVIGNTYTNYSSVIPSVTTFGKTSFVCSKLVNDQFEVGRHYLWFKQVHYDFEEKIGHVAVIYKCNMLLNAPVKSFSETFGLSNNESKTIKIAEGETYSFTYSESASKSYSYSRADESKCSLGVILEALNIEAGISRTETVTKSVSTTIGKSETYERTGEYENIQSKTGDSEVPKYYRYEGRCDFDVYIILVFKVDYTCEEKNTYSGWGCGDWVYTYTPTGNYLLEEENVYFKENKATYSELFYEYNRIPGKGYALNYELYSNDNVIYTNYF